MCRSSVFPIGYYSCKLHVKLVIFSQTIYNSKPIIPFLPKNLSTSYRNPPSPESSRSSRSLRSPRSSRSPRSLRSSRSPLGSVSELHLAFHSRGLGAKSRWLLEISHLNFSFLRLSAKYPSSCRNASSSIAFGSSPASSPYSRPNRRVSSGFRFIDLNIR